MPARRRVNRELVLLFTLFGLFAVGLLLFEQVGQRATSPTTPSSYNAKAPGVKALYLLMERQGFRTARLQTTWDSLAASDGLIVVVEPFARSRQPLPGELNALRQWIQRGGTMLYFAAGSPRPLDPQDPIAGDIALAVAPNAPSPAAADSVSLTVESGNTAALSSVSAQAEASDSPYLRDVEAVSGPAGLRLEPAPKARYDILFRDKQGALVAHKTVGRGHLILSAINLLANNGVRQADNAVFLVNVAQAAIGGANRTVVFDEYHHGIGFDAGRDESGAGILASLPRPFWLACLPLASVGLLLLVNGNRRFGAALASGPTGPPPSTDYIGSMARLFRRAGAADVALQTIYERFIFELARSLFVPIETPPDVLAALAAKQHGIDGPALLALLSRCEAVRQGQPLGEAELLPLARQLDHYRRKCNLVGS